MSADPYLFGGSPQQVRRTQQRFAALFSPGLPVLDIGCGRGIFLELLRAAGVHGIGIDTYEPAVEHCRRQGLEATVADALDYLPRRCETFGGIFCSHVIEHLPFAPAQELISKCSAALTSGGILVVVTPNCRDFSVMGETFWLDPTHVRPYPLPLLVSMSRTAGLEVTDRGTFHGGLPKREWPKALLYRCFLGPFYGRPNAYLTAKKLG